MRRGFAITAANRIEGQSQQFQLKKAGLVLQCSVLLFVFWIGCDFFFGGENPNKKDIPLNANTSLLTMCRAFHCSWADDFLSPSPLSLLPFLDEEYFIASNRCSHTF